MITKQLMYLADALSSGIVLGARVPIALTSRGDDRRSWLASATLVQLVAHVYRHQAAGSRGGHRPRARRRGRRTPGALSHPARACGYRPRRQDARAVPDGVRQVETRSSRLTFD